MSSANVSVEVHRLDAADARPEFACGDPDIDEFFHKDSIEGSKELICVTYAWIESGNPIGFFSVSNDAIKKEDCPRSAFERIQKMIARSKRYSSMPAVKIGRLGVMSGGQRAGCGSRILDFLKVFFTHKNKTGCRFLIVDAYNTPEVIAFYKKNGFNFLVSNDEKEETRIMYFDLISFVSKESPA